ncbi:MAG TPA: hypothetical protein ENH80_08705 [Phycisphaerae bacterium]|nr:hypothetical protein [Phycisphaerae bacterium]
MTTDKRKRRRWLWGVGVLLVFLVWNYWPVASTITISPETTVITEPLNPDGTVNYFQAIVDRYSEGVTPENNAAVLLVRALGPKAFDEEVRSESLRQLGLTEEELKKDTPYFEELTDFYRKHPSAEDDDAWKMQELLAELARRPWTAEDYPLVAAWLEANEKPLQLIVEASRRERLYCPLVSQSDPPLLLDTKLQGLVGVRRIRQAVAARAMLRLGSGDIEGAREDALAVHRVGRGLMTNPTLIQTIMGLSLDRKANRVDRAMIASADLSTSDVRLMLKDRKALGEMGTLTKLFEIERFVMLDMVMFVHRRGIGSLATLQSSSPEKHAVRTSAPFDGDVTLRIVNHWWDRLMDALTATSFSEHLDRMQEFDDALGSACARWGESQAKLTICSVGGRILKRPRGRYFARALVQIMMPSLSTARSLWESAGAENDILTLALAAKLYKAEKGQWPADLAALAPEYVAAIPADRFTDEPLRYLRTDGGVTIYSLGVNMTDDGGLNYNEALADDVDGNAETDIPKDADDIGIAIQ